MEVRKITIVSTKTQKKSTIMSGAETLGELKNDLKRAGIDYEGMTFYEGTSKTELKTDESILPKDVPYTNRTTGETKNTNELVFLLTNPNKKIASGAIDKARVDAYAVIKAKNLQAKCLNKLGKNFTNCKTSDLISFIMDEQISDNVFNDNVSVVENTNTPEKTAINVLVNYLYDKKVINYEVKEKVLNILARDLTSSYDEYEIEDMFRDMCY